MNLSRGNKGKEGLKEAGKEEFRLSNTAFVLERERFFLNDPCKYLIRGILPEKYTVAAFLDEKEIKVTIDDLAEQSAMERFHEGEQLGGKRLEALLEFPQDLENYKKLEVYAVFDEKKYFWFGVKVSELLSKRNRPQFFIEEERVQKNAGNLVIGGWAVGNSHVDIKLFDEHKKPFSCEIKRLKRPDVADVFRECQIDEKCGFYIEAQGISGKYMYLVMRDQNNQKTVYKIGLGEIQILLGKVGKYQKKGMEYLKAYGVRALAGKVWKKVSQKRVAAQDYTEWLPRHLPTSAELKQQRSIKFEYAPKISLVVPLYKTKPEYLQALVDSLKAQTYSNWELCLSDGSGKDSPLTEILEKYKKEDGRIKVISNEKALQISENTNAAISIATGDYIAFGDHDDVLTAHAFYECVQALNQDREIEVLYSDEDKMAMEGERCAKPYFEPHFKPDFNIDLLHTTNYICHLFVVKKELLERVGGLRSEFDGAQDYDFIFRCVENTTHIYHIPKILYHWRCHKDSTAENPESKKYAFEAGKRAIQAHYERIGVKAEVKFGEYPGLYRTKYLWEEKPLVSILIPNKDHTDDLERCISSVEEKSSYRNFEYIIIENNSTEEKTFAYYKELEARNKKVRVVYWDGEFNYSKINNFGAKYAKGEYLLLLNNDTEVINPDWLEEMLGYCMRKDVGIVGARLYYPDDTIQHAGVVIGFGGIAGHCFVQQPRNATGYCHRIICAQDYSAVTAACMMVKRSVFEEVGELTTDLAVAFNDVDFCLKVGRAGYLVVYNPYVELYHYESKSRGLEDTPEKKARFAAEIAKVEELWPNIFQIPDPYYNPNLTLISQDFSLKRI